MLHLPSLLPVLGVVLATVSLAATAALAPKAKPATSSAAAPALHQPPVPPAPPLWFRQDYDSIRRHLVAGRVLTARMRARDLTEDSGLAFGDHHPYTGYAWGLYAEAARASAALLRGRDASRTATAYPAETLDSVYLPDPIVDSTWTAALR